jgi:subfamily B ATP-binding cassette protein MsbA
MFQTLYWIFQNLKPYKFLLILALIGAVLEGLAYSGLSFIVKNLIDKVLVEKNFHLLVLIILSLLGLGILKQIGFLTSELLYKYSVDKFVQKLRVKVYKKLINLPSEVFYKKPSGEWVGRLTNDTKSLKDLLEGFGVKIVREIFTALFLVGVLLYFDWKLFLVFVLITPLLVLIFNYFGKKRKKYSRLYQEEFAKFINFSTNLVENFENLKFLSKFYLFRLITERVRRLFKAEFKNVYYSATYLSAIEVLGYGFVSLILLYGGWRVINGELTAGTFLSFLGTLFLLYNSLQSLQRSAMNLKALEPIVWRIKEVLELTEEKDGSKTFGGLKEKIELRNVVFKYGNRTILGGINQTFPKGEKIFLYGPSGGGKSTLLKVLAGLYKNYGGKVLYDNTELREFKLETFRGKIYYQSQNVVLFDDTVRNNLLIANPNATEKELWEALNLAAADFVKDFPEGLDTVIGGGGVQLSGGQKQRLALARLFLKNPEVIFLDEATSALDYPTEEKIIKNIFSKFRDKNIFFISHREEMGKYFDRKLKLVNGKLEKVD